MPGKQPNITKRPLFYTLVYSLIGLALLLSMLPQFAALSLRHALPQLGIGAVEVGNIDINLLQGRVAIDELRFYRSAAQVMHLGRGELELDWRALLEKRLQLRQLTLQRFSLTVSQAPQSPLRIAGFAIPDAGESPTGTQEEAGPGWGFGIDRLELSDNQLHLIRPGLAVTLGIQQFEVGALKSWEGERVTPVRALLQLDDSQLQLDAGATPFATAPGASIKLNLSPLQLAIAQPLLPPAAGTLSGLFSAELELQLQQEQDAITLVQSGTLGLQQLSLKQPGMVAQGDLGWQGRSELQLTGDATRLTLDGRLDNNALTLQLADTLINNHNTVWQGLATLQLTPDATRIGADGQLALGSLQLQQADAAADAGPLEWLGKVDLQLNAGALQGAVDGRLEANALVLSAEGLDASGTQLAWQGEIALQRDDEALRTDLNGALSASGLAARVTRNDLAFSGEALNWQGKAATTIGELFDIRSEAALRLDKASLGTLDNSAPHTQLERLALPQLRIEGMQDIQLGTIELTGLQGRLNLTPQGMQPLQRHLPAADGQGSQDSTATGTDKGDTPRLRISGVKLSGNSALRFEDTTVTPRFGETLRLTALDIGAIDTAAPALTTPLELRAGLGAHSLLTLKGSAAPLLDPPELDIEVELQAYEMPPLTPYLVRLLGYRINSGQLDDKLALKIHRGMLEGETRLTARQLEVEPEDADRIAEFEQKTAMPMATALSLLRDKQGDIALTIPFSGSLDDPKFDFQDALNTAMAKALRSASVSYLKYLLQPYGSLITLVQLAGKAGGAVQLDPVLFAAGSAEAPPESNDYLERLATLFTDKKNLQLRLCGIATNSDLKALSQGKESTIPPGPHEALEQLARQRAEVLKQKLVEQYRLEPGRLFVCNPQLERADGVPPQVRLQL